MVQYIGRLPCFLCGQNTKRDVLVRSIFDHIAVLKSILIMCTRRPHSLLLLFTRHEEVIATIGTSGWEMRLRRDKVWEDIIGRGTDAAGVGWLLRGFYRDHVREMDSEELDLMEGLLTEASEDLSDYVRMRREVPDKLAENHVFRLMTQYYRYHSGEGHGKGGEYR